MKNSILSIVLITIFSISSFAQSENKLVSKKSHIKFFSHTAAEDIEANNYKPVSTVNKETGDFVFSIPMQSFEFEKSLIQKHYNSPKFLDTKQFPKGKLVGKITNIKDIKFNSDGEFNVDIEGEMTIHGVTKTINEKATITIQENNLVLNSVFNITLADYKIAFEKGKPSTNIAKTIEITVVAKY